MTTETCKKFRFPDTITAFWSQINMYFFIAFLERTQKQTFLGAFQAKEMNFRRKNGRLKRFSEMHGQNFSPTPLFFGKFSLGRGGQRFKHYCNEIYLGKCYENIVFLLTFRKIFACGAIRDTKQPIWLRCATKYVKNMLNNEVYIQILQTSLL